MTNFSVGRAAFLSRYYLYNLLWSKLGRRWVEASLERRRGEWEALHRRVAGQGTWLVVGNGPSLDPQDLTLFADLPSVASNKINLLYDRTAWRPTLYTIADPLTIYKLPASHYDAFPLTLTSHMTAMMLRTTKSLPWRLIPDDEGRARYVDGDDEMTPMNGFISGATITAPNLMLAMWAGAKTIYLTGCDHFYKTENHLDGVRKVEHVDGVANHFHPDYRKAGEVVNAAPIEWMNRGYAIIRDIADKRGVRIVNISRRSALETFERATVDEALGEIATARGRADSEERQTS